MKVKDLLKILAGCDGEAEVVAQKGNGDGCDTCGHGETFTETELSEANDLETKVVLVFY